MGGGEQDTHVRTHAHAYTHISSFNAEHNWENCIQTPVAVIYSSLCILIISLGKLKERNAFINKNNTSKYSKHKDNVH